MPRLLPTVLLLGAALLAAAATTAQVRSYRPMQSGMLPEERSGFTFCRLAYRSIRREANGSGFTTDYPGADQNLMVRLSQLTKMEVTWNTRGVDPAHAVVKATDPTLFGCPFLFASDVGTVGFSGEEIEKLRDYLLKGGFLWVDDFWGAAAWAQWVREIARVLPEYEPVPVPLDHPIFSTFYFVNEIPQIPSIQFWRDSGGGTSERGAQSRTPHVFGIFDQNGKLLVLMSHNTDIADGWEREGEDYEFFHLFSPRGYAVGVNVAIWSMTH